MIDMRGIDIRAILVASLAVLGIDIVSGFLLFAAFADVPANATEEQARAIAAALSRNADYLAAALVAGSASTVLGGYLVARMARALPYFNALAFAVLGIVVGVLMAAELPAWFMIAGFGLMIPAALLGAYVWKRQATSSSAR